MRKQLILNLISLLTLGISGFAFVALFVRSFGKENYAVFSMMIAIANSTLNFDGLQKPLVYRFAQVDFKTDQVEHLAKYATTFSLIIGFASALFTAGFLTLWWKHSSASFYPFSFIAVLAIGGFIVLQFSRTSHTAYLIAIERSAKIQAARAVSFLFLFISAYLLMLCSESVSLASLSLLVAGVVSVVVINYGMPIRVRLTTDIREAFRLFGKDYAAGFLFNLSVFLCLIIDKLFLTNGVPSSMADYMIPYEFVSRLSLVQSMVCTILLGRLMRDGAQGDRGAALSRHNAVRRDVHTIMYFSIISTGLLLYGKDIFLVWVPTATSRTLIIVYYMLIISSLINTLGYLGYNALISVGRFDLIVKCYVFMPVMLVTLCSLIYPAFGVIGVACAVVGSKLVDFVLFCVGAKEGQLRLADYLVHVKEVSKIWLLMILALMGVSALLGLWRFASLSRLFIGGVVTLIFLYWLYSVLCRSTTYSHSLATYPSSIHHENIR